MSAISAISLMLTPHPSPTTATNSLMTRCVCPVTNALLLSCTLFTLCRGKQRPRQSLLADRDRSSACVGGETGVRQLLRSEGRAEPCGNRTLTATAAAATLTLMNRARKLHQRPIPQLPDASFEPELMPLFSQLVSIKLISLRFHISV